MAGTGGTHAAYEYLDKRRIEKAGVLWEWLRSDPVFSLAEWLEVDWSDLAQRAQAGDYSAQVCVVVWAELIRDIQIH